MARLWQSGFELNSLTNGVEIATNNVSGGGALAVATSPVRTGTYSLRSSNSGAAGIARANVPVASAGNGPFYYRAYIYIVALPSALNSVMLIWNGTTVRSQIRVATDGTLELWDSTAKIGSSSSALSLNTWYRLELSYFNNTGTSRAELAGRLDGTEFASTTTSTNTGTADRISVGFATTNTSYDAYFDDLAVNDSTGSYQTSFPGEGKIVHLKPNANGTTNSWTIGAGSGSNYEQVDEVTPDDATTYLRSRTTNEVDEYAIEAFPGNSYDTINCIGVGFRATRSAGTTSSGMKVRIRSGSSIETATTEELATNSSFRTNDLDTNNASPFSLVSYVSPATSTAWTPTDVDSAEIGVITSTGSGDRYVHLGTIWASVDYATGTPPAPSTTKTLGLLGVG
jgi:hypothetical protein